MLSRAQPGTRARQATGLSVPGLRPRHPVGIVERMAQTGLVLNPDGTVTVTSIFDVADLPAAFQPKSEAQLQADADAALAAAQASERAAQQVETDVGAPGVQTGADAGSGAPATSETPPGDSSPPVPTA